jgi:DNA mismatch endonuclease (patch repair protein)
MYQLPATSTDFWRKKIEGNRVRDQTAVNALAAKGWRVLIVWECALRGPARRAVDAVLSNCEEFVRSGKSLTANIRGNWDRAGHAP